MTDDDKKTPMTPEEFAQRMSELDGDDDPEIAHREADDLMAVVLSSLGYGEGIRIYNAMVKWYD